MDNPDSLVKIRNLSFSRDDRAIFANINLDIQRNKIIAVMGPSGTGKTTLLKLIGGLLCPHQGSIEIDGQNIHALSRKELYQLRQSMGMLSQSGALFTHLTAFENVAFPLKERTSFSKEKIHEIVMQKLDAVGLASAKDLGANQLSGGMIRRVALARAIALNPSLIMYDEPFTGLDPIALEVIVNLIHDVNQRFNMTTILVSHDVSESLSIADYVYLINDAQIVAEGTPAQLRAHQNISVQQFIHGGSSRKKGEAISALHKTSQEDIIDA